MVHIYNRILVRHKNEWNWIFCRAMDGPRGCHTEWSKSEKQLSDINTHIKNLEKWYIAK